MHFRIKYTEAILSNITWKLLPFEITKMLIALLKNKFIVPFYVIFGTLTFPIVTLPRAVSMNSLRRLTD